MLHEAEDVQRFVAAHETGHLAAAHDSLPRGVTLACGIALVLIVLAGPHVLDRVQSSFGLWITGVVLWAIASYGVFAVGVRSYVVRILGFERQADDFAFQAGEPVTEQIAAWFRHHEPALTHLRVVRPLRCHPMPEERVRLDLPS